MRIKDRKVLARLMVIQGISQRDLAAAAGWSSHSYVGRLVRGQASTVDPVPARKVAARLGVRVEDLFTP